MIKEVQKDLDYYTNIDKVTKEDAPIIWTQKVISSKFIKTNRFNRWVIRDATSS